MMQSYSKAGDFTVKGKLKSALVDNAIYYGSYLFICGILLIYIALKPGVSLDGSKIKAIASSASNTWGLFLLILLLGYALVEVPRNLWFNSIKNSTLTYSYFKIAKLSTDKCEAEETVDAILDVSIFFNDILKVAICWPLSIGGLLMADDDYVFECVYFAKLSCIHSVQHYL